MTDEMYNNSVIGHKLITLSTNDKEPSDQKNLSYKHNKTLNEIHSETLK